MLRTPIPARELDAPAVVAAYKNLKYVERDFRHIKSDDLDLRPVFHRLEERVRAHVLICMLACYLTWHLRRPPQHSDFMTEHHDLRVLGRLAAAEQHQPAEDLDHDQVEQAKGHRPRSCRNQLIRPNRRSLYLCQF